MKENISITEEVKNVGKRVKEVRKNKGYSQEQLAKLCGYKGKSMISRIELGDRNFPINKLNAIADALNVKVEYLLTGREFDILIESELESKKTKLIDQIKEMDEKEVDKLIKFLEMYH